MVSRRVGTIKQMFDNSHVQLKIMKLKILQCYASTKESSEEGKEEFYDQLQVAKERVPKLNIFIIMGDINAKEEVITLSMKVL